MNIRDRQAIHQAAGRSLENANGDPQKILLTYLGIVTGVSLVVAALSVLLTGRIEGTGGLSNLGLRSVLSTAKTVLPLVQSLVFIGLELGFATVALRIVRGDRVSNDTLFGGFRRFLPMLRAQILLGMLYLGAGMLSVYTGVYLFLMLPMLGVALPFSGTVSYFLFLALSLGLQFAAYYFCMNKVAVTYATAYEALLPKEKPETPAPVPTANPWQDQY